ncbi:helix-turn-helix domain-containing protein [Photobacterium sanguinicancri]|uniref:helix-turn-helix domain-containing protein n=1 Tax=Photobacterium sanguinicancri TaxID=875932 RepID=UPI0026E41D70|nr:helix-turn-helix transcriptional regulator [Photobacterium sanguinicancri]MDO6499250.1 helix-turn-helix transcriptional regulator [Photobacterium sanguinicancri]MDO6499258.1 helix-turn-helix transcriptional regulator [Photobacterium sanguinicancri]
MNNYEHITMADENRASRFKKAILSTGTYEEISESTGISVSTLVRIASGKTEPKLSDAIKIAHACGVNIEYLALGTSQEQKQRSELDFVAAADGQDAKTTKAHSYVIWNLRTLNREDIQAIARQVAALSSYRYTIRQQDRDSTELALNFAVKKGNDQVTDELSHELLEEYGLTREELDEIIKKANSRKQ